MFKNAKIAIAALLVVTYAQNANAKLFGTDEEQHSDMTQFSKWESVLNKYNDEVAANDMGLKKMTAGLQKFSGLQNPEDRIRAVNSYVNNNIAYSPDSMVWGRSDYWAAPGETFARGEGDCDDYAIAKFFALKMMGFKDNDMRIVILRDGRKNEIHAVLSLNYNGSTYILDNQSEYVVQDTQISYYQPIYSLSEKGYWTHS